MHEIINSIVAIIIITIYIYSSWQRVRGNDIANRGKGLIGGVGEGINNTIGVKGRARVYSRVDRMEELEDRVEGME